MPQIEIDVIQREFRTDSAQLPVNVVLVQEIPGDGDPIARSRPMPIASMKDVATLAQPKFSVTLKDERQQSVEYIVDYAQDVTTKEDLIAHFSPEWVNTHLEEARDAPDETTGTVKEVGKTLNVQQRLQARETALERLAIFLSRRRELLPNLADMRSALQRDLERIEHQEHQLGEKL